MEQISSQLFELDLNIRYVAVNQRGQIVEMEQNPRLPSYNPPDTDRMEELVVNPVVLELAKRRGDLDRGAHAPLARWGRRGMKLAFSERRDDGDEDA